MIPFIPPPPYAVIEIRSHELWVKRGCPMWQAFADWFEAERQLRQEATATARVAISWRAEQLWDLHGRPYGRDLEFWAQAEREFYEREALAVVGGIDVA